MLEHLHIENMAVIQSADLDLRSGFTVLTGETGAGKSVLINSLNLLLGERVSRDCVRVGCAKATVSGVFTGLPEAFLSRLREEGVDAEDGEVLIQRDLSADGKGAVRVNGRLVTVAMLHGWAGQLISIHGQHDNQALLNPATHVSYLDSFAGNEKEREAYRAVFTELKQVLQQIRSISMDEQERLRRLDLLDFQLSEIDAVDWKDGEDAELEQRRVILANGDKIRRALASAYESLSDEGQGKDLLNSAAAELERVASLDPELEAMYQRLSAVCSDLDDLSYDLRDYLDDKTGDPEELDAVEERLDQIHKLKKKYGADHAEVQAFRDRARAEADALRDSAQTLDELNRKKEVLFGRLKQAASALTGSRKKAIAALEKRLTEQLTFLDMAHARFSVRLEPTKDFTPSGADGVEFLFSANPGQPVQPLSRIASGGELSRIMLGMKTVLSLDDEAKTLIFDEIDAGVSGKAAEKIAMKLKEISRGKQVIVVTHLAQIAAYGDDHFLIAKNVEKDRTFTSVERLDHAGRRTELSRIVGGLHPTEAAQAAAEDLLRAGAQYLQ